MIFLSNFRFPLSTYVPSQILSMYRVTALLDMTKQCFSIIKQSSNSFFGTYFEAFLVVNASMALLKDDLSFNSLEL